MPLFNWTEENSVGVGELDKQHQKLFSIVNNLYDLMTQSKAQEEISGILDELAKYADYHFKTEEKYFEQFNYENKLEHILLHKQYKEKVSQFIRDNNDGGGTVISFDILDFLEDWWLGHINNEDKRYTECFTSHGLR